MVSAAIVADAYDQVAPAYDPLTNPDRWIREALWRRYAAAFPLGSRILDAGCGTGIDSRWLAGSGFQVVAGDCSPAMLAQLVTARPDDVAPLLLDLNAVEAFQAESFDGIISAFAAFNTVENPTRFAAAAYRMLRPGGRLFLHFLNRRSTWDVVGALRRRDWRTLRAYRSRRERVVEIGGQPVRHRLYDPVALVRSAFAGFRPREIAGFGALRPPSGPSRIPVTLVETLTALETQIGDRRPFAGWGRFVLVDLERC